MKIGIAKTHFLFKLKLTILVVSVLQIGTTIVSLYNRYQAAMERESFSKAGGYNPEFGHFWNPAAELQFPLFLFIASLLLLPRNLLTRLGSIFFSYLIIYNFLFLGSIEFEARVDNSENLKNTVQIIYEILTFHLTFQPQNIFQLSSALLISALSFFDFSLKIKQFISGEKLK